MNKKIVEYNVVRKDTLSILIERVNLWIKRGFVPQGPIVTDGDDYYLQTMVRYRVCYPDVEPEIDDFTFTDEERDQLGSPNLIDKLIFKCHGENDPMLEYEKNGYEGIGDVLYDERSGFSYHLLIKTKDDSSEG